MGLLIRRDEAEAQFYAALYLARSSAPLPEEWLERAQRVGQARSKTFTPVLGTALLAKATDRRIDAFALRESAGHKGYSARSLAKEVLVPCCVREGIDIRNTGAEPLNNQPFLRAERIGLHLEVKANARADLEYLVDCITAADFLEDDSALKALAAFLRQRLNESTSHEKVLLEGGVLPLPQAERALDSFLAGDAEGGKIGQATVAALFDLIFDDVRTKRINDPSIKWPGDVGAFEGEQLILSAEVKQRPFTETEILLFAQRLAASAVHRGFVAALDQSHIPLDEVALRATAHQKYDVDVFVFRHGSTLLREVARYSRHDLPEVLRRLPERMHSRLEEIEASSSRRHEWSSLFKKRESQ